MRRCFLCLLTLCAVTTACRKTGEGFNGGGGPVAPAPRSPWADWVLFNQPESDVRLNYAFAGVGAPAKGCYVSDTSTIKSGSLSEYKLSWTKDKKGGITATIAHFLGFDKSYEKSATGVIEFDSLYVARAISQFPVPLCNEAASDLLPIRPAIAALIGAKSFTYDLRDKRGNRLNLAAQAEIKENPLSGGVTFDNSNESRIIATFKEPRWFGAQYVGYEASADSEHAETPFTDLGRWAVVGGFPYQVRVESQDGAGQYLLTVQSLLPGGKTDTLTIQDGQSFNLGQPRNSPVGGAYFRAQFSTGGKDESQYLISASVHRYVSHVFARLEDRDSLAKWVNGRVGRATP
jgi:hypothetical protein